MRALLVLFAYGSAIAFAAQDAGSRNASAADSFLFLPGTPRIEIVARLGEPQECFSAPAQRRYAYAECATVRRASTGLIWDVYRRRHSLSAQDVHLLFRTERVTGGSPRVVLEDARIVFDRALSAAQSLDALPEARELCAGGCDAFVGGLGNLEICAGKAEFTEVGAFKLPRTVISLLSDGNAGMTSLWDKTSVATIWTSDRAGCEGASIGGWRPGAGATETRRLTTEPVRYEPPPEQGRTDMFANVIVHRSDDGDRYQYEVSFALSKALSEAVVGFEVYGLKVVNNIGVGSVPPGVLHNVAGDFAPGQQVTIPLSLPKRYTDPSEGWSLRFCAQLANRSCFPSRNLLVGAK